MEYFFAVYNMIKFHLGMDPHLAKGPVPMAFNDAMRGVDAHLKPGQRRVPRIDPQRYVCMERYGTSANH